MIFCVSFLFLVFFGCTSVDCSVALKTYHGKYVVAWSNGEANAHSDTIGADEIWTVTFIGADKVHFKGAFGNYLTAESDGDAVADRPWSSTWETFTVVDMGNGGFAFKSYHNKYLVAENDGFHLNADRDSASTWETFEVELAGKKP